MGYSTHSCNMLTTRSILLILVTVVIHLTVVSPQMDSSTAAAIFSTQNLRNHKNSSESRAPSFLEATEFGAEGNAICPNNTNMNDKIRLMAKEAHNYRRSQLAQGLVKNKMGNYLPKAANMREMMYNCDLEKSAYAFAKGCTRGMDPSLPSGEQQNHFYFMKNRLFKNGTTIPVTTRVEAMRTAIMHWWKQIYVDGGIGKDVTFTPYNEGKPIQMFTRMAWATSDLMGCGVASCGDYWSVVCHYKPGGNNLYEQLYMKGAPCSACPGDMFCTTSMLCASVNTVT